MLKNMAIHELALLATYWGVTTETIDKVEPDVDFSRCLTLKGPGGDEFTDFSRVGFTITTKDGAAVTLKIDRCGDAGGSGNSMAIVTKDGEELFKSVTPDAELEKTTAEQAAADPEMMPYFFLQHDDYITLKERTAAHVLEGKVGVLGRTGLAVLAAPCQATASEAASGLPFARAREEMPAVLNHTTVRGRWGGGGRGGGVGAEADAPRPATAKLSPISRCCALFRPYRTACPTASRRSTSPSTRSRWPSTSRRCCRSRSSRPREGCVRVAWSA